MPKKRFPRTWGGLGAAIGSLPRIIGAAAFGSLVGCASLPAQHTVPTYLVGSGPAGAITQLPSGTPCESVPSDLSAKLRSWVVFIKGRHLRLDFYRGCSSEQIGRLEFGDAEVIEGRPGITNGSFRSKGQERIEARYHLPLSRALCLLRPRHYEAPYRLIGPNSSSALRSAIEECGIPLPPHVKESGGPLGHFPGIEQSPGRETL